MVLTSIVSLVLATWLAVDADLPANPSLDPVRDQLEQTLRYAEKQGLPRELLLSKVREGIAKRVSPHTVAGAVEQLARHLAEANMLAKASNMPSPSPRLLQAIAEGRLAGLSETQIKSVLVNGVSSQTIEAIDALADLHLRGYEPNSVLPLIQQMQNKDPGALVQLAPALEIVRRDFALTNTETAQMLDQGFKQKPTFDQAVAKVRRDLGTRPSAQGRDKANKETGMSGRGVPAFPGKGRGLDRPPRMGKNK